MNFSLSRPTLCATAVKPVTGTLTVFSAQGKETIYLTPPLLYPPASSEVQWFHSPLRVTLQGRRRHCHTTLCATYSRPLPLHEYCPLPGGPTFVRYLAPLSPDVSGSSRQCLYIIQVILHPYMSEHFHCHCQYVLYPDVVSSWYDTFIRNKDHVNLSCRPTHPMPHLLWSTDYPQLVKYNFIFSSNLCVLNFGTGIYQYLYLV